MRQISGGATRSGRAIAREPVQGEGFDVLAAAHSRALARMSDDIAAAIRAEAESGTSMRPASIDKMVKIPCLTTSSMGGSYNVVHATLPFTLRGEQSAEVTAPTINEPANKANAAA